MTKTTDTFPRDCEMTGMMLRMGYSYVPRAHDAAIVEEAFRSGRISQAECLRNTARVEAHQYSFCPVLEIIL